jgi:hypothetical protein
LNDEGRKFNDGVMLWCPAFAGNFFCCPFESVVTMKRFINELSSSGEELYPV